LHLSPYYSHTFGVKFFNGAIPLSRDVDIRHKSKMASLKLNIQIYGCMTDQKSISPKRMAVYLTVSEI